MAITTPTTERDSLNDAHAGNSAPKISDRNFRLNTRVLTAVTPRQSALLDVVRALHAVAGAWPSGVAVARAVGLNNTSVYRRLKRLERIGVILWAGGDVRIAREPDGVFLTMTEVRA